MSVDFLNNAQDKKARRTTAIWAASFTIFVGILAMIGASASYRSATRGTTILAEVGNLPVIGDIRKLVLGEDVNADSTANTPDGHTNIMLFGVGGAGHDGPQLTDTIIFSSIDTQNNRVGMLSIPRDMAYPLGGGRFEKINAVNAYAEQDNPGQGAQIASKAIGKLLGVRVDHVIKIDFGGFEKFINILGGIDLTVEKSFVDNTYPTDDYGVTTVSFKAGPQHMSGADALVFVRSRHGSNGEGSDFARQRRQQLVLEAVREKLLSLGTLANPQKIAELWSAVSSHIQTDMSAWDFVKLAPFAAHFDRKNLTNNVLSAEPGGELIETNTQELGYAQFPRKPDWSEIRALAQDPFESKDAIAAKNHPTQAITVEIKNGTTRTGFAGQVAAQLTKNGYIVAATENAVGRGHDQSIVVDLTNGSKNEELARLTKLLDATVSSATPSGNPESKRVVYVDGMTPEPVTTTSSDFLIILGQSSLGLVEPYASQATP